MTRIKKGEFDLRNIDDIMQEMLAKSALKAGMQLAERFCYSEEHIPLKERLKEPGELATANEISQYHEMTKLLCDKYKRQMMLDKGQYICPRCQCQSWTDEMSKEVKAEYDLIKSKEKFYMLGKHSLIQDQNLKQATFKNYNYDDGVDREKMQHALQIVEAYKREEQWNTWLVGPPGIGKSWTAMSMLRALNDTYEVSCLFIDIDEMLRKIRGSFNDDESIYTEDYLVDLVVSADFVVLDDLGAETGNIQTGKEASDFTSRVLRAIVNGRQNKSTIITTNLSVKNLTKMYDPKLVDRLMRNIKLIKYPEDTPSKRIQAAELF